MYDYLYEVLEEASSSPSGESRTGVLGFGEEAGPEYRAARENSPGGMDFFMKVSNHYFLLQVGSSCSWPQTVWGVLFRMCTFF